MKLSNYLFLLLVVAAPAFSAASTNGDETNICPKTRMTATQTTQSQDNDATTTASAPAAARPTPLRTNTRGTSTPRTVSPRWHTMLPGMFR